MIAASSDYRLGVYLGWVFGSLFVGGVWMAAAQYRRDRERRDRNHLDALARIHHRKRAVSVAPEVLAALQRHLEKQGDIEKPVNGVYQRSCEWCGAPFATDNENHRYCNGPGKRCRHKASAFRLGRRLSGPEGDKDRPPAGTRATILAATNLDRGGWRDNAACVNCDPPDLFFPVGKTGGDALVIAEAKAICADCPVRQACLDYALDAREDFGIWGGLTEIERRPLLRQHRRVS